MEVNIRKAMIADHFKAQFGQLPTIWVQAPGRVDLMGSHTDYNDGFVLTQAIDRNTWMAAAPREDNRIRIGSLNLAGASEFGLDEIEFDTAVSWSNYVRGVTAVLQQSGYQLQGFDGLIHSTIPFGSGLSSSAALEVATAVLFNTLCHLNIDPVTIALLCQRAENEFVGMNCGILDQYSSAMGQKGSTLLLDCRYLTSQTKPIAPGISLVICDTKANRALTGSEYPERRAQCEAGARILANFYPNVKALRDVTLAQFFAHQADLPELIAKRCRFIIEENERVLALADALAEGEREMVGEITAVSYTGARDLYEITCTEMEQMMSAIRSGPGIIGARQAGAGFGGCMVAFVDNTQVDAFTKHVNQAYAQATNIQPEVYSVAAAAGAGLIG